MFIVGDVFNGWDVFAEAGRHEQLPCRGPRERRRCDIVHGCREISLRRGRINTRAWYVADFGPDARPLNQHPPVVDRLELITINESVQNLQRCVGLFKPSQSAGIQHAARGGTPRIRCRFEHRPERLGRPRRRPSPDRCHQQPNPIAARRRVFKIGYVRVLFREPLEVPEASLRGERHSRERVDRFAIASVGVRSQQSWSHQSTAQPPARCHSTAACPQNSSLQLRGSLLCGRHPQQLVGMVCVDRLILRHKDLAAFFSGLHGISGDVNPISDILLALPELAQDDKMRETVGNPVVEVGNVALAIPPTLPLAA